MEPRPLYWSIRRELWENRSIYLAPLIVAAVVLFATSISTLVIASRMRRLPAPNAATQQAAISKPFSMAPAPIMFTAIVVGFLYCLDALYGERRDRSILFWKSLPVSDLTTVVSKAAIPLVVLPLIALALSIVTQIILMQLGSVALIGTGMRASTSFRFFQGLPIMFYGLTIHELWFAPIYAWILLISAWARRAPVLWVVVPPLAIAGVERIAFNSWYFMNMLQYRMTGAMKEGFILGPKGSHDGDIDRLSQLDPLRFLSAPGLWVGLAFAAACFAVAVRLRRNREPI